MRILNKAMIPLLMALLGLGVVVFMLPFGAEARQEQPNQGEIAVNPQTIPGTDIQLSAGTGSSVPEVATNANFVAVVFVEGGSVYLRAAHIAPLGKWSNRRLLDTTNGNFPKLALSKVSTNTVHVVWTGQKGGVDRKAIRHISCTMAEPVIQNCSGITEIAATTVATTFLDVPDIVVDNSDRVHVVWVVRTSDAGDNEQIRSAVSTNNGATFGPQAAVDLDGDDGGTALPTLAGDANYVHLAYVDREGIGGTWKVEYRRTNNNINPHVWGNDVTLNPQRFGEVLGHDKISNPTIAAGSSQVYLAWDTQNTTNQELYGLIGIYNTNSGATNAWENPRDVTSTIQVSLAISPTDRRSVNGATPSTENQLRPSVALSSTNDFVIVWQERPADNCTAPAGIKTGATEGNGTFEIYYAERLANSWSTLVDTLANNDKQASIDPDIAIDSQGRRHMVFMKAVIDSNLGSFPEGVTCKNGGSQSDYGIFYRGPIADKWPENEIFLPVIIK